MKIISEAGRDYLVKMSKSELEIILGMPKDNYDSRVDVSDNTNAIQTAINTGKELNVSKFYTKLQSFNKIAKDNNYYGNARAKLTEMLDALTPVEELIDTMATKLESENIK